MWNASNNRKLGESKEGGYKPHMQNKLQSSQLGSEYSNRREGDLVGMCFPYNICHCRDTADRLAEEDLNKSWIQLMKWEFQLWGESPTYNKVKADLVDKNMPLKVETS